MRVRVLALAGALLFSSILFSAPPVSAASIPVGSCSASLVGSQWTVTWQSVAGVDGYVVYRSVNGGSDNWRGRSVQTSFADADRTGTSIAYKVATKTGSDLSPRVVCSGPPTPGPVQPPASCSAQLVAGQWAIEWQPAQGADAYVVYRSVNGSRDYWRGRISGLSFADTDRAGASIVYRVVAKAGGQSSDPVTCSGGAPPPPPAPLAPPSVCSARLTGSAWSVTWDRAQDVDNYIVYRSVNGGSDSWRGRTSALSLSDSHRSGVSIVYRVASKRGNQLSATRTTCTQPQPAITSADAIIVGDMASCGLDGSTAVGNLLDQISGPIWATGDLVYEDGTLAEFQQCFEPKLGRHLDRFSAVPGNHEYQTPGASGFFTYLGLRGGEPDKGYYSQDVNGWKVLFLNSNCGEVGGCFLTSPQYQWLQSELAAVDPSTCIAAVMHHPRWSSWGPYADQAYLDQMLALLDDSGMDILFSGHAHHYERLAPLNASRQADPGGFVSFTVGTGGIGLRVPAAADVLPESQTLLTDSHGILALDMEPTRYRWDFVDIGGAVRDSGARSCNS